MKKLFLALFCLVGLSLFAEVLPSSPPSDIANNAVDVGDKAPDFMLYDTDGNQFALSSLRGKYVLLVFWGTWCPPCIRSIPRMKEFYEEFQHEVEIVGVAIRERSVEHWRAEVQRLELPWINVINDDLSAVNRLYQLRGVPTRLLISPDGTILLRQAGGTGRNFYNRLERILRRGR